MVNNEFWVIAKTTSNKNENVYYRNKDQLLQHQEVAHKRNVYGHKFLYYEFHLFISQMRLTSAFSFLFFVIELAN